MNKGNKIVFGITLFIAGIAFLLKEIGLPTQVVSWLFDLRMLLILLGVLFIALTNNKVKGLVLLGIGSLAYLNEILQWTRGFSNYIWPLLLIVAGALLFISGWRKN